MLLKKQLIGSPSVAFFGILTLHFDILLLLKKQLIGSRSVAFFGILTLHFDILLRNYDVFGKAALFTTNQKKLSGELFLFLFFSYSLYFVRNFTFFKTSISQWGLKYIAPTRGISTNYVESLESSLDILFFLAEKFDSHPRVPLVL